MHQHADFILFATPPANLNMDSALRSAAESK